jgi:microsomal prostaglandin-E synthase 2
MKTMAKQLQPAVENFPSSMLMMRFGFIVGGAVAAGYWISTSSHALCDKSSSTDMGKSSEIPVIYQYKICPYCHRVKAYLDYLKINYESVEVNPITRSEISFSKDHKKVPIAKIDGQVMVESTNIIKHITEKHGKSLMPESFFKDSDHWLEWSDRKLAIMLYPNITRSFDESWECFGYANDVQQWSVFQRFLVRTTGPAAMLFTNGKIKKKYGIEDERKELKEVLNEWVVALDGKKFINGDEVSLADLMVFGTLRAIRNFQTFREVIATDPILKAWFDNVDAMTNPHDVCKI